MIKNGDTLKEITEQAKKMDWDKARAEGITNRKQFLEKFPAMGDWLEQGEKTNGAFMGISSISFTDGRCVFMHKWEKNYFLDFHNPANDQESQEKSISLSYEALQAVILLLTVYESEEDSRRFWVALGYPLEEVEQMIAGKYQRNGK